MNLEEIRKQIDLIDDQIIGLLKQRVNYVKQVGDLKKETSASSSFIRAGREATMLRNLINKAGGVFPPAAIATIWRMVISASLSIEQEMTIYSFKDKNEHCTWLAREYFGTFTAIMPQENIEVLISKVANNPSSVGVLPLSASDTPWWVRPKQENNNIYVFARIPFLEQNSFDLEPVLAIANTYPEPTGDDISLFSVITTLGPKKLIDVFAETNLNANVLFTHDDTNFLIEVTKFISKGDPIINQIHSSLEDGSLVRLLGSYAVPIIIG